MKNLMYILFAGSFLLPSCGQNKNIPLLNDKAALPNNFHFDTLGLKVMSSFIQKRSGTMSTLYANPLALTNAIGGHKNHDAGEVLALVTWKQQADDHWFGANIPGNLQSVELISTISAANGNLTTYKKFTGKDLVAVSDTLNEQNRIRYIFDLQPSLMP